MWKKCVNAYLATEEEATSWKTIRQSYEWIIIITCFICVFTGTLGWIWNQVRLLKTRMEAYDAVEVEVLEKSGEKSK